MTRPPIDDINSSSGLIGVGNIPGSAPVGAFNIAQVESLLITKGIKALHYKSALNPDRESLETGVNVNTKAAHYGIVYYQVREILVVPQSISLHTSLQLQGIYETNSVAALNVAGHYTDGRKEQTYFKPRDLIVLNPSITVLAEQLLEYNPNGILKPKFKVKGVDALFSKDQKFREGVDFAIAQDGTLRWLNGRKPKFSSGKGEILSLAYWISPHYLVNTAPHSLRLLPSNDLGSGGVPREVKYGPQQVVCVQSHLTEIPDDLDFFSLPDYAAPNDGQNTPKG